MMEIIDNYIHYDKSQIIIKNVSNISLLKLNLFNAYNRNTYLKIDK